MSQHVSNQFPKINPGSQRLAIIGEAPSDDDTYHGAPFQSAGGRLLKGNLSAMGINPKQCFFGNVCQFRIPYNDPNRCWNSDEVQASIKVLQENLNKFKPTMTVGLGPSSLRFLNPLAPKTKKGHLDFHGYRGSLFKSPTIQRKALVTYHPNQVFRNYSWMPFFKLDLHRAKSELSSPVLNLPERNYIVEPDFGEAIMFINQLIAEQKPVTIDLEGYPNEVGVTCISLWNNPYEGITVPFRRVNGSNYWETDWEEREIWMALVRILGDNAIPIIAQNAMYELFVFAWSHRILITNVVDDTMLKHWEMYHEMDKNLGLQTSIYTREPYYKDERTVPDSKTHWIYCGKDSAVTHEINDCLETELVKHPKSYEHYKFNIDILRPYLYMQLKGNLVDKQAFFKKKEELKNKIIIAQSKLNQAIGAPINVKSSDHKNAYLYGILKAPPKNRSKSYEACQTLASISLNLPPQKKRKEGIMVVTSDEEAILTLLDKHPNDNIRLLLDLVHLRTMYSDLHKLQWFPDGRIRCSYNPVGTDTGRLSSRATPVKGDVIKPTLDIKDGQVYFQETHKQEQLGTNLQNVTKDLRTLFIADPDHDFFQYDLAGADAWTVACDCAALGAPAMLEDMLAGVKPSKVIILMQRHGAAKVMARTSAELKEWQNEVDGEDVMYTCAKACQHGTNYGMQPSLLRQTIFKRSGGTINIDELTAGKLQFYYEQRYKVSLRTEWIHDTVHKQKYFDCASGAKRRFLGIRPGAKLDTTTLNTALSHEPQANTTYLTNKALHRMWYDTENRKDGKLIIEPMLMVHDALCGQWHKSQRQWAITKLKEYFNNPITIHGITVTIPADGGWGPNWKDLPNEI